MSTQFIWLSDSCVPRKGRELKRGGVYAASDYPDGVLAEWLRSGAAELVKEPAPVDVVKTKTKSRGGN